MGDKIVSNKEHKENALLNAAYELFTKKDINATAVDDIVKKAGVAKGTFYLYFKDKYDILDRIVLKKTGQILSSAILETENRNFADNSADKVVFFINYIIDYLKQNNLLL